MSTGTEAWLADHLVAIVIATLVLAFSASCVTSSTKSKGLSAFALGTMFIGTMVCIVAMSCDIHTTERAQNEFYSYLVSTPRNQWSFKNKYASVFFIDGKSFAVIDGYKYLLEKASDGSVFIYSPNGRLEYGLAADGRVERF